MDRSLIKFFIFKLVNNNKLLFQITMLNKFSLAYILFGYFYILCMHEKYNLNSPFKVAKIIVKHT